MAVPCQDDNMPSLGLSICQKQWNYTPFSSNFTTSYIKNEDQRLFCACKMFCQEIGHFFDMYHTPKNYVCGTDPDQQTHHANHAPVPRGIQGVNLAYKPHHLRIWAYMGCTGANPVHVGMLQQPIIPDQLSMSQYQMRVSPEVTSLFLRYSEPFWQHTRDLHNIKHAV